MRKATSDVVSIQLPVWEVIIGMLPNEEGNEQCGEQLPGWEVMIGMLPNVEGGEHVCWFHSLPGPPVVDVPFECYRYL